MEKELFDYSEQDDDQEYAVFLDPVLKVQIGQYPAGTTFDQAVIGWKEGTLSLFNYDDKNDIVVMGEYKLHLVVDDVTLSEVAAENLPVEEPLKVAA